MVRLSLYNQGRLCGAHAILRELGKTARETIAFPKYHEAHPQSV